MGGGQSGCQIAEDLAAAGRTVHLCTSRVGRIPRRHRGRDILDWWEAMHVWDVRPGELEDPSIVRAAQALASGVGRDAARIARTIAGAIAPRADDRHHVDPVPGVP